MRTVEEHQAAVNALLPAMPEEVVPVAEAHGRVLARDVVAQVPLPGFDNSAMDGYAARWAEVGGAADQTVRLPVAEDIPAGRSDVVPLAPGTVHRPTRRPTSTSSPRSPRAMCFRRSARPSHSGRSSRMASRRTYAAATSA